MSLSRDAGESSLLRDDAQRRQRAKERLYVLCQLGGWGLFVAVQLVFVPFMQDAKSSVDYEKAAAMLVMFSASGLLLTHFSRSLVTRWGWKSLGWRALSSRVLLLSVAQAAVWTLFTHGYFFVMLKWQVPPRFSLIALLLANWISASVMLLGWHVLYFFYHLYDRLNRSEIERLQLVTTVKDAELRTLKSQVNPHFIFNSLNSLRALIDEEPARARQAVTQLANLLRYSLQSGQLETVAFEDELRIVNDYLALEQVRHEERLRVRLDIAPETLSLPVPPMLLQTLVENAVKYGISTRPEGGEIAIVARKENGALRFQVTNPGELRPAVPHGAGSIGLGLRNAAERLRLLFGDRASLQLRPGGTAIVVAEAVLPLAGSSA